MVALLLQSTPAEGGLLPHHPQRPQLGSSIDKGSYTLKQVSLGETNPPAMLDSLCDTLDVYDYNDVISRVKCYKVSSLGMMFQVGLGRKRGNAGHIGSGWSLSLPICKHPQIQPKEGQN